MNKLLDPQTKSFVTPVMAPKKSVRPKINEKSQTAYINIPEINNDVEIYTFNSKYIDRVNAIINQQHELSQSESDREHDRFSKLKKMQGRQDKNLTYCSSKHPTNSASWRLRDQKLKKDTYPMHTQNKHATKTNIQTNKPIQSTEKQP